MDTRIASKMFIVTIMGLATVQVSSSSMVIITLDFLLPISDPTQAGWAYFEQIGSLPCKCLIKCPSWYHLVVKSIVEHKWTFKIKGFLYVVDRLYSETAPHVFWTILYFSVVLQINDHVGNRKHKRHVFNKSARFPSQLNLEQIKCKVGWKHSGTTIVWIS